MINETVLRRILYVGTGLVILAFLISVFIVLPHLKEYNLNHSIPGNVFQFLWVVAVIHLIVAATMGYTIWFSFRKGNFKNGFLVTDGVVLISLSLLLIGSATDYLDLPGMKIKAISMFICCGLDFIAGVLSFMIRFLRRPKSLPSNE
jgi:magnesium-transporting ATPase (P-type)